MNLIFFLILIIILNFIVTEIQQQQQENITHSTTTLSEARYWLAATSSGELVFFAGGYNSTGQPSDRVDIYNVTSGSWTTATLSIPRGELAATSSQNLVFFGGGSNGTIAVYDRVDIYHTSNGSWSTATLSQNRSGLAATSVGNFVLFGGGRNSTGYSNVVDVFNVTSNTWTTATLSQSRGCLAATSVDNRYALFGGGWSGQVFFSNAVDIFDSLSGMWNTTTLSQPRPYLAATSLGNLAFFGGGPSVDIFNSTSQTWRTATLSQARYDLAASSSIGEIVAFGGGWDGSKSSSVVDMLNVTNNTWFTVTLSQPRHLLASTSSTNKIFFGGGQNSSGYSEVVDIFEIPLPSPSPPASLMPSQMPLPSSLLLPSLLPTSLDTNGSSGSSTQVTIPIDSVSPSLNETVFLASLLGGIFGGLLLIGSLIFLIIIIVIKKKRKKSKHREVKEVEFQQVGNNQIETVQLTKAPTVINLGSQTILKKSQIASYELLIEKEIGEGSYGKVFLGRWNNQPVALKFCVKKGSTEEFMREAEIMIQLPPHPNVVQMFGVSLDGPQPVIIMEYCVGGSLDKLLYNSKVKLSEEHKFRLIRGIAAGMLHLHKHNIIHRDLAARNILLTENGDAKISDFGMSRVLERAEERKTQTKIGPVCWMPPESLASNNYSMKSDVWSFGIVVYEIVAQQEPYKNQNPFEVMPKIRDEGLTPEIPSNCPQKLRELMQMCWKKEPQQRPTFETICHFLR